MFSMTLRSLVFSSAALSFLASTACGNGDDVTATGKLSSDAGAADGAASTNPVDAGSPTSTMGATAEIGCDQVGAKNHVCVDYQYLTPDQADNLTTECQNAGNTVIVGMNTSQACPDSSAAGEQVGSCEVATGNNIKQFTIYYPDDGFTEDDAQDACIASNGTFK